MRVFVFVFMVVCLCLAEMNLILLKEAAIKDGAVCLNGGPAGYRTEVHVAGQEGRWEVYGLKDLESARMYIPALLNNYVRSKKPRKLSDDEIREIMRDTTK